MPACLFLITRILLNVHWSMEFLHRCRRDQRGPDMASNLIITSTTFYLKIHDLSIFPVPKIIKTLQILCTKEFSSAQNQWSRGESQKNSSLSCLLHWFPDNHLSRAFYVLCWSLAMVSKWFYMLWTLPLNPVDGELYPEESPENWNKSFSEIMQGSILPTPPNYTWLHS